MRNQTPGPWRLVEIYPEIEPQELRYAGPFGLWQIDYGNRVLAHVHDTRANANLIAAAPDLLAALEAIVTMIMTNGEVRWHEEGSWQVLQSARAALRKAKGETQ